MTKKLSAGVAVVDVIVSVALAVVFAVVVFGVVDAATAEPATNTATAAPSAKVMSVAAPTVICLLTRYPPWYSPRARPGAGRAERRLHRAPRSPPGLRSSAAGRRRAAADRRCRR